MSERPSWDEYFSEIARVTAKRGDCLRAQVGCVIVVENRIVATGYNGPPPGGKSCVDGERYCPRGLSDGPKELCPALHAEQNAVAYAGREARGGVAYVTKEPCPMCRKLLRAAGVAWLLVVDGLCPVSGTHPERPCDDVGGWYDGGYHHCRCNRVIPWVDSAADSRYANPYGDERAVVSDHLPGRVAV